MKRSKLKLQLNRETLATLDRSHLRFAGADCTCSGCTNCTCCPTCATCGCPPQTDGCSVGCWTDTCTQDNQSNCICA